MRTLSEPAQPQPTSFALFTSQQPPIFLQSNPSSSVSTQEITQCSQLLQRLIDCQPQLARKAELLLEQVQGKDYKKGIGYYNSKNLLMLEYLIQLQFYQLFKINGEDLTQGEGLQLYKRMAYLKTLLSKLPPVEKKLEYQKNKLIKYSDVVNVKPEHQQTKEHDDQSDDQDVISEIQEEDQQISGDEDDEKKVNESDDDDDALAYQPRPQALMQVKQKKQKQAAKEGKYVAPKMAAVLSREDKRKRKQDIQEQRKKAHLIQKYRDDLEDDEEARERGVGSHLAEKMKQRFREKTAIEEDNFMRMPDTKRDRFWKKSLIRDSERGNPMLQELKQIEQIRSIFTEDKADNGMSRPRAPKRKAEGQRPNGGNKKVKRN